MIRRPCMYAAVAFASAIAAAYYYGAVPALLPAVVIVVFFFSDKSTASFRAPLLLVLVSYVSGTICFICDTSKESAFTAFEGDEINIVCVVSNIEMRQYTSINGKESEYMQIKAKTISVGDNKARESILIKCYDCPVPENTIDDNDSHHRIFPGGMIEAAGTVAKPQSRRNPGCYDYALYLKSLGVNYIFEAEHISLCKRRVNEKESGALIRRSLKHIYLIKENFLLQMEASAGRDTAGLMRAILFGEKNGIEDDTLEEFQKNGTAHVLAVSGLHVGIIYAFLSFIWRWKKGKLFFTGIVVFFIVYMAMASFSPSVVRAVIMIWLHVYATLTHKRYDMVSAAFCTAMVMLIKEPMQIFNAGFQMSFLAVLTLSLLIPVIRRIYNGVLLAGIAVQLGLTPYTIYTFNYFSIAAVFINVPVIFLTGIIVPAGLVCMVMVYVCEPLGDYISSIIFGLCRILTEINSLTGIEGITVFKVCSPDIRFLSLYYLSLLFFVSEEGRLIILRKRKALAVGLAILAVLLSLLFGYAAGNHFKRAEIVFVDVGQGDCMHLRAGRENYLVDGGGSITYNVGKKTLMPYLLKNGADDIEGAFVTHLHTDHYKGIAELCREGMIDHLFVYEGYKTMESRILKDTGLQNEDITYLYAGQTVELGDDSFIEVLWPEKQDLIEYEKMIMNEKDENSLSLIMKVTIKGKSILATGDVDIACLDEIAKKYGRALDSDILKAAHHGSRYSDSVRFAEAADPEHVVFQVGKNNFGHPNEGVVENFRQKGIMIYRNDIDGAIAFDFVKKGNIEAMSVKGE